MLLRKDKIITYSEKQNANLVREREHLNVCMKLRNLAVKISKIFFRKNIHFQIILTIQCYFLCYS
jgi:hypothetical protein